VVLSQPERSSSPTLACSSAYYRDVPIQECVEIFIRGSTLNVKRRSRL
jgi:hypothetical protein